MELITAVKRLSIQGPCSYFQLSKMLSLKTVCAPITFCRSMIRIGRFPNVGNLSKPKSYHTFADLSKNFFQIPLLPEVMVRLLAIVNGSFPLRAKELAVSCIGSAAVAVEVSLNSFTCRCADCSSNGLCFHTST
jgi:hypothetical protein